MYYNNLLKLCAFNEEEIQKDSARIAKAFEKLEIGPKDCERAEERVRTYFDVNLLGIRQVLGLWIKELVDLVLAKEDGKRILYYSFPSIGGLGLAVALSSEKVYCGVPETILCHAVGQIFGGETYDPILEAGERNGLPPGLGLCSLNQCRIGAVAKGVIAPPEVTLTSAFFCEQTCETDDLTNFLYGSEVIPIDSAQDSPWGEFPEYDEERVRYMGREINDAYARIEKTLGFKIPQASFDAVNKFFGQFWMGLNSVNDFQRKDPYPLGAANFGMIRFMGTACGPRVVRELPGIMSTIVRELKQKVDRGEGAIEKGTPRAMWAFPSFSDPAILHMVENVGLGVPVPWLCWFWPTPPWKTQFSTFGEQKAEVEMKVGMYNSSYACAWRFKQAVKDWKVDGAIWAYPYSCRPFALTALTVKKEVEEELGIPTLSLEIDMYDSRNYSAQALRNRVEAFAEMLQARRA